MSARVSAPPMMSEPPPTRTPTPRQAVATPAAVARVRRDLFGPVDRDATRRFLERELAAQSERDADRWGFDFAREAPRRRGPGTARYAWERVAVDEPDVPETYALRRLRFLQGGGGDGVERATNGDAGVAKKVEGVVVVAKKEATEAKQTHITDFLKKQKSKKRALPAATSDADADACAIKGTDAEAPPRAKLSRPAQPS